MRSIVILLLCLFSTPIWSQSSGFMGKHFFVELAAQLHPFVDLDHGFSPGLAVDLGYSLSDRTSLVISYNTTARSKELGVKVSEVLYSAHFTRFGFIAPMGKAWIVGYGTRNIEEEYFVLDEKTNTEKHKTTFIHLAHEARIPIQDKNYYFLTRFAVNQVISRSSSQITDLMSYEGRFGLGLFF